jgi:aspartokinase/homoserine dehydrogenase 1
MAIVMKFGGTSVGSPEAVRKLIAIVQKRQKKERVAAVVVSAFSGVTNQLIEIGTKAATNDESYKTQLAHLKKRHLDTAQELIRDAKLLEKSKLTISELFGYLEGLVRGVSLIHEVSPGAMDYIMSYGERLSAHIIADAFVDAGVSTEYLNARAVIVTDDNFGNASVNFAATNTKMRTHFKEHLKLQLVTGFIGATLDGRTTTLGRGGSDYTASIVGAALDASVVEIWTDVSGVMTADPRIVKDALPVRTLSYSEAVEVSYFGAKVIHPPTMQPAREKKIPILIKNTFDPDAEGTIIGDTSEDDGRLAKGITSIRGVALLTLEGSGLAKIADANARYFAALARIKVNVIIITQASSQNSITVAVSNADAERATSAIHEEFALERRTHQVEDLLVERDLAVIAVVGEQMKKRPGIAGKLFQTLGVNGVNVKAIAQGSSELNISVVVSMHDAVKALNAVHTSFFYPKRRDIHVFLIGTGLIGGTFMDQITEQKNFLERERGVCIKVMGVSEQRHMLLNEKGVALDTWRASLSSSKMKADLGTFIRTMKEMELPNKVFVDCTASEEIASQYADLLRSGIWIVTPNKRANSGPYKQYAELQNFASFPGVQFFYETNVGAGLPIINTLNDLRDTGDQLVRVEAILSGTLSYIFNNFVEGRAFSDVVREAKTKGYTEPDPRADLSGEDVARKILILAREAGHTIEMKDVKLSGWLSKKFATANTTSQFFSLLEKENATFEKMRSNAAKNGKRLRYIARLEKGIASVGLEAVDSKHPFYDLQGSDNVVAFTTTRYKDTPLVVKGPGAGADVTAGGVLADILRIGMTI